MTGVPLLAAGFIMTIVAALFLICCVALILIILIQKGKGGGLSSALAGGMASGILGSKTGDFLTWVTIVLVGVFLLLAVLMARFYKPGVSEFGARQPAPVEQPVGERQPTGPEQPLPAGGGERADSNLPGG